MLLTVLDLIAVAVFAVSGALAAAHAHLDIFGIVIIAAVTAIGGGTLRDVLLDRHPVFWIARPIYLIVIGVVALATAFSLRWVAPYRDALLIPDALGLALFALSGADLAVRDKLSPLIVVFTGTVTGVAGGVMRDVLLGQVPNILRHDIYASAAIAGIVVYLLLLRTPLPRTLSLCVGMATVVTLRLVAVATGLQLPVPRLA